LNCSRFSLRWCFVGSRALLCGFLPCSVGLFCRLHFLLSTRASVFFRPAPVSTPLFFFHLSVSRTARPLLGSTFFPRFLWAVHFAPGFFRFRSYQLAGSTLPNPSPLKTFLPLFSVLFLSFVFFLPGHPRNRPNAAALYYGLQLPPLFFCASPSILLPRSPKAKAASFRSFFSFFLCLRIYLSFSALPLVDFWVCPRYSTEFSL